MTSGEKVALSLLAEICKLKAEQAETQWQALIDQKVTSRDSPMYNDDPRYELGYFKGVLTSYQVFEKRLSELVGE